MLELREWLRSKPTQFAQILYSELGHVQKLKTAKVLAYTSGLSISH